MVGSTVPSGGIIEVTIASSVVEKPKPLTSQQAKIPPGTSLNDLHAEQTGVEFFLRDVGGEF